MTRSYEHRPLRRQKIRYNYAGDENRLYYQLVRQGQKWPLLTVEGDALSYEIFDTDGTSIDTGTVTSQGAPTVFTIPVDTTTTATWPVGEGYRCVITSTLDGANAVLESGTAKDEIIFDVAKFVLWLDISFDQLWALDDRLTGMNHGGDETFAPLIDAVRDELQIRIEAHAISTDNLPESAIIDKSRISIPARYLMLSQIFESKGDPETAERYAKKFETLWTQVLGSMRFDLNGDVLEDSTAQGLRGIALRY